MTIQLSKNEQKLNDISKTPLLPIKISFFYMTVGIVLKNRLFSIHLQCIRLSSLLYVCPNKHISTACELFK